MEVNTFCINTESSTIYSIVLFPSHHEFECPFYVKSVCEPLILFKFNFSSTKMTHLYSTSALKNRLSCISFVKMAKGSVIMSVVRHRLKQAFISLEKQSRLSASSVSLYAVQSI